MYFHFLKKALKIYPTYYTILYQTKCKIFLDEFEMQETLRREWLNKYKMNLTCSKRR